MFFSPWVWKDLNKETNVKKFEKIARFVKKIAKIRDVKMLKPFHYHYKQCSNLLSNPRGGSLTPRADKKNEKCQKKIQKA